MAATVFLSQKTVEANLSRIYRKLGIRSRAELGLQLMRMSREAGKNEPPPEAFHQHSQAEGHPKRGEG